MHELRHRLFLLLILHHQSAVSRPSRLTNYNLMLACFDTYGRIASKPWQKLDNEDEPETVSLCSVSINAYHYRTFCTEDSADSFLKFYRIPIPIQTTVACC